MPGATESDPAYLTFLIELPINLGMHSGATVEALEQADPAWPMMFISDHPVSEGLRVDTRFVFRTSRSEVPPRTHALDAFDDFWIGLRFVDSAPAIDLIAETRPTTVVAATTGLILPRTPEPITVDEGSITACFDKVLGQLNEFLTMLGFRLQNPDIGPMRRTDLQAQVPVVIDANVRDGIPRSVELSAFQLHTFGATPDTSAEAVIEAHDLAFRNRKEPWAFGSVVTLLQRAYRDRYSGDRAQSVIALGTAIELLVEACVAASLRASGASERRIEGILNAGLTGLLRDHLGPMLGRLGADASAPEAWIVDAYRLRKLVVHEGYTPAEGEARRAFNATVNLIAAVKRALMAEPDLAELADHLPFSPAP